MKDKSNNKSTNKGKKHVMRRAECQYLDYLDCLGHLRFLYLCEPAGALFFLAAACTPARGRRPARDLDTTQV